MQKGRVAQWAGLRMSDATVRNGSLTATVAEQGVSRPAISKQIKLLEQMLNCALLDCVGTTEHLTPAGRGLSFGVGAAFDQIAATAIRLATGNGSPDVLPILVDRDFASSHLAGHIGQFLVRKPGV